MVRVRFFASIRERLGRNELTCVDGSVCVDVAALIRYLDSSALPGCAAVLGAAGTLVAVNQELASDESPLADGDEVAFYPPVTGG